MQHLLNGLKILNNYSTYVYIRNGCICVDVENALITKRHHGVLEDNDWQYEGNVYSYEMYVEGDVL